MVSVEEYIARFERKVAWEYFPEDVEPRKVAEKLTAGTIELSLEDVFRRG